MEHYLYLVKKGQKSIKVEDSLADFNIHLNGDLKSIIDFTTEFIDQTELINFLTDNHALPASKEGKIKIKRFDNKGAEKSQIYDIPFKEDKNMLNYSSLQSILYQRRYDYDFSTYLFEIYNAIYANYLSKHDNRKYRGMKTNVNIILYAYGNSAKDFETNQYRFEQDIYLKDDRKSRIELFLEKELEKDHKGRCNLDKLLRLAMIIKKYDHKENELKKQYEEIRKLDIEFNQDQLEEEKIQLDSILDEIDHLETLLSKSANTNEDVEAYNRRLNKLAILKIECQKAIDSLNNVVNEGIERSLKKE